MPCKRISDFIPPSGNAIERLNWLEDEVVKISSAGLFANGDYAVTIEDFIVHTKPLPKNALLIEALDITDPDDFDEKKKKAVCDLKKFFGKPVSEILETIHIIWSYRPVKIVSPEQNEVLAGLSEGEIQQTPGCEE